LKGHLAIKSKVLLSLHFMFIGHNNTLKADANKLKPNSSFKYYIFRVNDMYIDFDDRLLSWL